jgi:DNA-binding CsgD family transcriptional regulator
VEAGRVSTTRFTAETVAIARAAAEGTDVMVDALRILDHHVGGSVFSVSSLIVADQVSAEVALRGARPLSDPEYVEWQRLIGTHPYFAHLLSNSPSTSRLTDVVDLERFEQTELYQALLRPRGSRYQTAMPLVQAPGQLLLLSVWREDRDFSDTEIESLERFRAVLAAGLGFRRAVESLEVIAARLDSEHLSSDRLTRRQQQVAALVELGLTNRQIGIRLGLTERTVRKHIADLFQKLGCGSRTLIAVRWRALYGEPPLQR